MRISDWSSDVCSADLRSRTGPHLHHLERLPDPLSLQFDETGQGLSEQRADPGGGEEVARLLRPELAGADEAGSGVVNDRKSVGEGKSGYLRVDLGGRRHIRKKPKDRTKQKRQT